MEIFAMLAEVEGRRSNTVWRRSEPSRFFVCISIDASIMSKIIEARARRHAPIQTDNNDMHPGGKSPHVASCERELSTNERNLLSRPDPNSNDTFAQEGRYNAVFCS